MTTHGNGGDELWPSDGVGKEDEANPCATRAKCAPFSPAAVSKILRSKWCKETNRLVDLYQADLVPEVGVGMPIAKGPNGKICDINASWQVARAPLGASGPSLRSS